MKTLGKLFFRGLAAILPLAMTGYLVWAAVAASEAMLHRALVWSAQELGWEFQYWPGMGIGVSVLLVVAVGLLMYSFVVRTIYNRVAALLNRIPVIKSVYGMIVDVVQLFSADEKPFSHVVLVRMEGGGELLGFLTRERFDDIAGIDDDRVAVYLPMSYQLGGFTVIVPRSRIKRIAMPVEQALRFCVTAGVQRPGRA